MTCEHGMQKFRVGSGRNDEATVIAKCPMIPYTANFLFQYVYNKIS